MGFTGQSSPEGSWDGLLLRPPLLDRESSLQSQFVAFRDAWWPAVRQVMEDVVGETTMDGSPVRQMFAYHLQTGGKRLRAILPLLIGQSLGASTQRVVPFAAACEMLHNASLIHDDIQDGDSTRRGNPTVWKKFGTPQAINLGDAMIAFTLLALDRLDVDSPLRERVKTRVLREMLRVIDGQAIEFDMKAKTNVTVEDYMKMVEGKTSSLFSLPVGGAALLSGADEAIERALIASAYQIGVLFQIVDDVVDLFDDKARDASGGDISEGKPSILVVHFMQSATGAQVEWLSGILDKPPTATTPEDVEAVRMAFRESGSLAFALNELDRRRQAALAFTQIDKDRYRATVRVLEQACDMFLLPAGPIRAAFAKD
jgi:geranylgeranyl diphosphate synthase, type I